MEIRYEFTGAERDVAMATLASRRQRDAAALMCAMAGGAALSMIWPFEMDFPGATRAGIGALLSAVIFFAMRSGVEFKERYDRYRDGLPIEPGYMRGLEPGARVVSLSLDEVREKGPFGERVFRWSAFGDVVESEEMAALIVSSSECVVIPRWALSRAGHGDLSVIATLVRHARDRD